MSDLAISTSQRLEQEPLKPQVRKTPIFLAALTLAAVCAGATYLDFATNSGRLAFSNLPVVVLVPFTFWFLANLLFKRFQPRLSLSTRELRTVFCVFWIGGLFAGFNWVTRWIGAMATPRHYASPENRWEELLFDHLPWWMYPTNSPGVIDGFFLGLNRSSVPWEAWITPLFWTIAATLAMTTIGLSLTAVFHKQWVQYERLTYPLAQASLELTDGFDRLPGWPPIIRNRIFWIGFTIAAFPLLFNLIEYWNLGFPHIAIFDAFHSRWSGPRGLRISRYLFFISYRILPTLTGFLFLCDVNILFSVWSLFGFGQILLHTMHRMGFSIGLAGQSANPNAISVIFSHGAMMSLALFAVWTARGHLRQVFAEAIRSPSPSDNTVIFTPRGAAFALLCASTFMIFWLHAVGFSLFMSILWLLLFWAGVLTAQKFLAASGYAYTFPYYGASVSAVPDIWVGSAHMSETTLVGFRLINEGTLAGWRLFPILPHIPKLLVKERSIGKLIVGSLVTGLLSAALYTIWLCYTEGAASFDTYTLRGQPVNMYRGIANLVSETSPSVMDPGKITVWILGGLAVALFSVLQARIPWWPFHPVGVWLMFEWYVRFYYINIVLVWLAKVVVLKFGGIGLYRKLKLGCYGLILGYSFGVGCSLIVDLIWFPEGGHFIHAW